MSPDGGFKKGGTDPASHRLPGEVLGLGLNVVVSAFFFGGQEYLTLLGGFIGAAAGFYSLYAHLTARQEDQEKKKPR